MAVKLVRAAGGVVTRDGPGGLEVVLVHRAAYDDWSFPKGKLEPGEDELTAALREVEEETGLACTTQEDLGAITYVDGRGRPKVVRYWRMAPQDGPEPSGQHEIDDARWMPLADAEEALTYAHDRRLVRRLRGEPPGGGPVPIFVLRHANAEERAKFKEPDELRPISETGRTQMRRVVEAFWEESLTRLVSSPFLRCVQSLESFSDAWDLDITLARELSEAQPAAGAEAWVLASAADGPAMLCTHGDVLQELVRELLARGVPIGGDGRVAFAKAGAWRLDVLDGRIVRATYLPPPSSRPGPG